MAKQFLLCTFSGDSLSEHIWDGSTIYHVTAKIPESQEEVYYSLVKEKGIPYALCECGGKSVKVQIEDGVSLPFCSDLFAITPYEINTIKTVCFKLKSGQEYSIGRKNTDLLLRHSSVSRQHARLIPYESGYMIVDQNSTNGTFVNGHRITSARVNNGDVIEIGRYSIQYANSEIIISEMPDNFYIISEDGRTTIKRSPRLKRSLPNDEIQISAPPRLGAKPETNWLSILLPASISIAISIFMAVFMNNKMMMVYMLPMTLGGLVVSVTNYLRQAKKYRKQVVTWREKYTDYLFEIERTLKRKTEEQLSVMLSSDPNTQDSFDIVAYRNTKLWQRRPSDPDYMMARIGSGIVPFSGKISAPQEGLTLETDPLLAKAKALYEKYRYIENAPIVCDLSDGIGCGVIGKKYETYRFINNLFIQLTSQHCYSELKIICICDKTDENEIGWVQRLPHFQDDSRSSLYYADSMETTNDLLGNFVDNLKQRKNLAQEEGNFGEKQIFTPHLLFVFLKPSFLEKSSPIIEYLFHTKNLGTSFIMVTESLSLLPGECTELIELHGDSGIIYRTSLASQKVQFNIDQIDSQSLLAYSEDMKNLYCESEDVKSSLPKSISFFDMLGISSVHDLDIRERWKNSDVLHSLRVPIGIGETGKLIYLDLHESAHGPHGLVAGTTGSGKSELLQSYILSIAVNFHPYEASFLLIDFKGGGMANQFSSLPHVVGCITNIEGDEVARSLLSLKAELTRRQRLFAESGVNNIENYIRKYRSKEAKTPIPHLIIIVDEFAELKAEQPEFMKELISTARIGRSLGVHLILATQKPAGQVSDQIWSNSRFQLCLKVATLQDSNEVIRSPLAARIREPGRAYLRVGNNEIFELFQSGYSGAHVDKDTTQLQAVVSAICAYYESLRINKLQSICFPPLPNRIEMPEKLPIKEFGGVCLGILDDPASQYQGQAIINVTNRNTIVIGASQTGKTSFLQSVIFQLSSYNSPKDINLYIIDMGAMTLKVFEPLHHVGGVVTALDSERMKSLFRLLTLEVEQRKQIFSEEGISSFASYRDGNHDRLPQIVVLIDNVSIFKEVYGDEYEEILVRFLREGLTYGISFVLSNPQTSGIGYKYLSSITNRLALFCNDSADYTFLFDRARLEPKNIPGRAITVANKSMYELQCYLPFTGHSENERNTNIKAFVSKTNSRYPSMLAKKIPSVPKRLSSSYLTENYPEISIADNIPFAINYDSVECVSFNIQTQFVLGLAGRNITEKNCFLDALLKNIGKNYFKRPVSLYIIDNYERKLGSYKDVPIVKKYYTSSQAVIEVIENIYDELKKRFELLESGEKTISSFPWIVCVINSKQALTTLADNRNAQDKFNEIYKQFAGFRVLFLVSELEDASINSSSAVICKKIKDDKKLLYFGSLKEIRIIDVYGSSVRGLGDLTENDDAYYFSRESVMRVKTIQEE